MPIPMRIFLSELLVRVIYLILHRHRLHISCPPTSWSHPGPFWMLQEDTSLDWLLTMCKSTSSGTCECLKRTPALRWLQAYDSRTEDGQQAWRLWREELDAPTPNSFKDGALFVRTHGKSASQGTPVSLLQHNIPWSGSFGDWCPNIRDVLSYYTVDSFQSDGLLQGRGYCYCLMGALGLKMFILSLEYKWMKNLCVPGWGREGEQRKSVWVGWEVGRFLLTVILLWC